MLTSGLLPETARIVFQTVMTASLMDDRQFDGAGYTDGHIVVKTARTYNSLDPALLTRLDHERNWVGHVRKASAGTALVHEAAHPYVFKTGDHNLYFVHNGFIPGPSTFAANEVNTDSWRECRNLVRSIPNGADLTAEKLISWLRGLGDRAEFAFALKYKNETILVRGNRKLYTSTVKSGDHDATLVNTSQDVLEQAGKVLRPLHGIEVGNIVELSEHTVYRFFGPIVTEVTSYKMPEPAPAAKPAPFTLFFDGNEASLID
jgi:hypothetical protein